MKISTLFLAFITSGALMMMSGCSDDPVIDIDEFASTASGPGAVTNDNSLGDSTPTGRVTADGFFVLYNPAVPEVFSDTLAYTQQEVVITVFAEDVNDLVELNGQTINFKAEWGAFLETGDSCDLVDGQCSVTWRSGAPGTAPGSCLVSITAYTIGEEAYFDGNDDNTFDSTDVDVFDPGYILVDNFDLPEPFLDINENGVYDAAALTAEGVGELIDIIDFDGGSTGVGNLAHDGNNNLYEGSQCNADNAANCSGRTSMMIHTRSFIQIQNRFDEPTGPPAIDVNGNGFFNETNILYCGDNPT